MGPIRLHGEDGVSMAQLSMPTSFMVAPLILEKSSMRAAVASSWNTPVLEVPHDVRYRTPSACLIDETPEIIHAYSGQWLDKNVYPLLAAIADAGAT